MAALSLCSQMAKLLNFFYNYRAQRLTVKLNESQTTPGAPSFAQLSILVL